MAVTKSYKVYGVDGHRQRESFNDSYKYDFSEGDEIRIIEVENSDRTGTNDYSIVHITRNTIEECQKDELEFMVSEFASDEAMAKLDQLKERLEMMED